MRTQETAIGMQASLSDDAERPVRTPSMFSTHDLPRADQFDAWRGQYRQVFDLNLAVDKIPAYPAVHTSWDVGSLRLTRASMPPNIIRRWSHWARPVIDDWLLVVAPARRRDHVDLPVSHLGFRSLPTPFEGVGGDGEVLTLFLPRDVFREQASVFDRAPVQMPYSGMASLVADFLLNLEDKLPVLSAREIEGASEALHSLIAASIAPFPQNLERARSALARAVQVRARRIVRQNLHRPDLGPDMLARSLGISRSPLYRAFEPYGGVAAFIQHERLDEAHRRLVASVRVPSIGSLALDLGFSDHTTFSRAFRRRFGYSPRELLGATSDEA